MPAERGPLLERFLPLAGTRPKADLLEGLDFSWRRWPGTEKVAQAVEAALRRASIRARPHASIPALLRVHEALSALPEDNPWKAAKLRETEALVAACAGLFLEARAAEATGVPGGQVTLNLMALNRSPGRAPAGERDTAGRRGRGRRERELAVHAPFKLSKTVALPEDGVDLDAVLAAQAASPERAVSRCRTARSSAAPEGIPRWR